VPTKNDLGARKLGTLARVWDSSAYNTHTASTYIVLTVYIVFSVKIKSKQ
jgi:hypothetical protein